MSRKVSANVLLTIPILIISIIILIIVVLVYRRVKKKTSIPTKRVSEDTCVPRRESCTCTIERRSVGDGRGYSKEPGRRAECNCTAKSIKNQPKENNTVLIGQNDRRIHAIQKNSQIIIPEQYVHDQNTEHIGTARSTSARVITSHVTPDDNFYIKMIAVVGPEGGTISSSETGVSLFIPEMAVPAYKKQNVEIQVSSKLSPFNLKFDDEDSGLPLTPVVHCLSPGRNEFCKRMQLKIPHRAILEENSRFRVRYSHSPLGTKMKWKTLEMPSEKQQNNVVDDFSFTVDEKYFYISTLHFTTFLCESCGKTVNLNLQSVIYGRYELRDGIKQEVYFNVYIFDAILDSEKAIEKNERAHAQRSEHYSLKPNESMNQWCIALLQPPDWKWKLDPRFDGKQVHVG
ncbi:uncharacterized protein [Ptychodera flava]|uniref:uncharacterized protein n=1 Tax=Ptychodera flava TaxID=63121 RepID=UPI00396A291D